MNLVHEETREGFTIRFFAQPEEISPRGQFQNEDGSDDEETISKIEDGTYAWFCAKVTASKAGVTLGADYLGACCYDSEAAFVTPDGYYPDMVNAAIEEAKATLATLCECEA